MPKAPSRRAPLGARRVFWPFLAPALILYTAFLLGPIGAAVWVSFHKWDGVSEMQWRGVDNYKLLLDDDTFKTTFVNTLLILVAGGIAIFVISFALTMVLREMKGRKFVRSVLFFPNIIAPIALSVLWGFLFSSDGLVNSALRTFGVEHPPNWLGDNLLSVIFMGLIWTNTGFYVTVLMAGVDRIPAYYYDETQLAGASAWQRFWHVTLPLSWDVVATAAVLWTISSLKIFEFIYAFGGTSNDLPPIGVWNTAMFIYGQTFGGRVPAYSFGYASASAVITLLVMVVFVVLLRRLLRRERLEY